MYTDNADDRFSGAGGDHFRGAEGDPKGPLCDNLIKEPYGYQKGQSPPVDVLKRSLNMDLEIIKTSNFSIHDIYYNTNTYPDKYNYIFYKIKKENIRHDENQADWEKPSSI